MILALTRSALPWSDGTIVRRVVDEWHLLAVADDPLTRVEETPEGIEVTHSALFSVDRSDPGVGSHARVDLAAQTVMLHQSMGPCSALYFTINERGELFCASRVTRLQQLGVRIEEDRTTLPEFFVYCHLTPPATFYRGISAMPLGDTLTFDLGRSGWRAGPRSGFTLPSVRADREDFSAEVAGALERAFAAIGPLDDRTAVLLSGGVDSSVLAAMARRLGSREATYGTSYPFERPGDDLEREYALSAAAAMGGAHEHHVPTLRRYLTGVVEAVAAAEMPIHGLQTVLLNCVYRDGQRERVRLVLNGDGADTAFGSGTHQSIYCAGRPLPLESLWNTNAVRKLLWRTATGVGGRFADRLWTRKNLAYERDDPRHIIWWQDRFGDVPWTRAHFGVDEAACSTTRRAALARHRNESIVDAAVLLNLANLHCLTVPWSLAAQSAGRAQYFPYLHPAVVETALSIPWPRRVLPETKQQLRTAARRLGVPDMVLTRPKACFGIEPDRWAGPGGPLEPLVRLAAPIVGADTIRGVQLPDQRLSRIFWNLLIYAIWYRLFIKGETSVALIAELHDGIRERGTEREEIEVGSR